MSRARQTVPQNRKNAEPVKERAEAAEQFAKAAKQEVKIAEQEKKLTKHLLSDQRLEDLQRALDDAAFRDQLLQEYGIR